jgi:hypothetical protein
MISKRMGVITKKSNPGEFEEILNGSANGLQLFAQQIEAIHPTFPNTNENNCAMVTARLHK